MKNILWLFAGSALLASCSVDTSAADAQAQVDSIVTSKTALLESRLQRNNDSLINAMAAARADSMLKTTPAPVAVKKDTTRLVK